MEEIMSSVLECEVGVLVEGHPCGEGQCTAGNTDLVLRKDVGI